MIHLLINQQEELEAFLIEVNMVEESFYDLWPSQIPVQNECHPQNENFTHFSPGRLPPLLNGIVQQDVSKMLHDGMIDPSVLPWALTILVQRNTRDWIEYRSFNQKMKTGQLLLPNLEEILEDVNYRSYCTHYNTALNFRLMADINPRTLQGENSMYFRISLSLRRGDAVLVDECTDTFQNMMNEILKSLPFVSVYKSTIL